MMDLLIEAAEETHIVSTVIQWHLRFAPKVNVLHRPSFWKTMTLLLTMFKQDTRKIFMSVLVGVNAMIIGDDDFYATVNSDFYCGNLHCMIRLLRQLSRQGSEEPWDFSAILLSRVIITNSKWA